MKNLFVLTCIVLIPAFVFAQHSLPSINLKTTSGETINMSMLADTSSSPLIISFWATWCAPCLKELEIINDVYEDWQNETGVKLYAVSIDDSRSKNRVATLAGGKGWQYTILYDDNQDLQRALNIANPPYSILIYKGKIAYQHSGFEAGDEDELYSKLKNLIP